MGFNQELGAKVKRLRQYEKLTLVECSDLTGLSAGFLSQVENGKTSPSLENLNSIAQCLGVNVGYFFADTEQASSTIIVRQREQKFRPLEHGRLEASLTDETMQMNIQPTLLTLPPKETAQAPRQANGDVFLYVIDGILTLQLGENTEHLHPSDSAHFDGSVPHAFWNESPFVTHVFFSKKRSASKEGSL